LSFSIRTGSLQCGHVMTSFIIVLIFIKCLLIKYLNQFFWRCSCEEQRRNPTTRPERVPSLRASPIAKPPTKALLCIPLPTDIPSVYGCREMSDISGNE
jgi:hypothetical protein